MSDVSPANIGWFKSRASNGTCACVEVCFNRSDSLDGSGETVSIRDSKYRRDDQQHPDLEPIIIVSADVWSDFVQAVANSRPTESSTLAAIPHADGTTTIRCADDGVELHYTTAEWEAFTQGVHAGEFDLQPAMA